MHIFAWLVFADIVTGFAKSWFGKETSSTKGLQGVIKHLSVVMLVLIAYPYLNIFGYELVAIAFVTSFILSYAISIAENWTQLGWPMPDYVKDHLAKIQQKQRRNLNNLPDYGDGQSETENTIYENQDQSKG
nr:phage holin family protein [Enterococcus innesii]